jgi:hypothetical protein
MIPWLPLFLFALGQPTAEPPIVLESAKPYPALTRQFVRTDGWTGADGAVTIPLSATRTLWLFGDTFIGRVEAGKRVAPKMVNNTAAWQDLTGDKAMRFFWGSVGDKPKALLVPKDEGIYYWPGDGAIIDGKLYLFVKTVRPNEKGAPAFQFDWFANDFLTIGNPAAEPTAWQVESRRLPHGDADPRLGAACLLEGDYLYAYGLFPTKLCKRFEAPLMVARIRKDQVAKGGGWEYWCRDGKELQWSDKAANLEPLFRDGAPEFTVGRIEGIPGFVAVYIPLGLGRDIVLRHATRPEGPWSAPLKLFRCPDEDKGVFQYAAKHHPELATEAGQIIVTYCRNTGKFGDHMTRPELYAPQAVEIRVKSR